MSRNVEIKACIGSVEALEPLATASVDLLAQGRPKPRRDNTPAIRYQPRMDAYDRKILDVIQSRFPISERPYADVGAEVGLTEAEVLARVRALRQRGVIRRMGANFQSDRLGWQSTLCAARVPEEQVEAFVAVVNKLPNVTHNYLRQHAYNVWFTYVGPSMQHVREALAGIKRDTGIEVLNLPAERLFKIKVDFAMEGS